MMETCFALTIFRDGFDFLFVIRFGTLLFCKTFHWILSDRVNFVPVSNKMGQMLETDTKFHFRMLSIMGLFFTLDVLMTYTAISTVLRTGPTMLIVFGFEYAILTSFMIITFTKYVLHTVDINRTTPWEEKSIYFFYVDLTMGFEN